MKTLKRVFRFVRFVFRWSVRLALVLLLLGTGLFCGYFAPQLYHHFWLFPQQAKLWRALDARREPVALKTGWNEYRGVMHSHSEVSHDSEATPTEIAAALKKAKCQFICMSDHYVDGKADYSLGKKGMFEDILFIRGFEMNDGLMPWGLPDDTVFTKKQSSAEVARKVRELGGVTSVSHAEAWRPWDIPELDAMEIYNIHTDLLDEAFEKHSRDEVVKEFIINMHSYGDQTLRYMFDEWVLMMLKQKWDWQNLHRKITGIAANDVHQNVGIVAVYTDKDTLMLLDTGHTDPQKSNLDKDKVAEFKLNDVTRKLLDLCFGPLEPGKRLLRIDGDPYERSARFVNTHILARELTEPGVIDAIRQGRAFVAFNMIADAEGFAYVAQGGGKQVTMGESIELTPDLKLLAETPLPCQFTLVRNGETVTTKEGKTFEFEVKQPGKYRIEAALKTLGEWNTWSSWIIANPIEVTAPAPAPAPEPPAPVVAPVPEAPAATPAPEPAPEVAPVPTPVPEPQAPAGAAVPETPAPLAPPAPEPTPEPAPTPTPAPTPEPAAPAPVPEASPAPAPQESAAPAVTPEPVSPPQEVAAPAASPTPEASAPSASEPAPAAPAAVSPAATPEATAAPAPSAAQ